MNKLIDIQDVTCLRGPNMWTYGPALEARVDIGSLEESPSNTIPGLYERLTSWLPTLSEHRCSYGEPGGFLQRLREGTWAGHILEHVTLELQNLAGMGGGFGRARSTSQRGIYKVVVRAAQATVSEAALRAGRDLLTAAIQDRPFDVDATLERLRLLVNDLCLGPSTACIVKAAEERRIPVIRLNEGNLVQLGHGARQHRIWTAETDLTGAIAQGISRDKELTRGLLRACGVPVPDGRLVSDADDTWEAAQEIGTPVVVKPNDASHGRAVFTDLRERDEIRLAYAGAREESRSVIVEAFVVGDEHRMLVVGGRLVAAARGAAALVVGDGMATVGELIERELNSDPRRGDLSSHPLDLIKLDSVVRHELSRQGLAADSVPAAGRRVLVRRHGNIAEDVTDSVHASVAAAVCLAARVVGLDIAGIDVVAADISRPLAEQGGAIVAVNSGPGLLPHLRPANGEARPVGAAIVDHLFGVGDCGRIAVTGIAGTSGTTGVARLVAHFLQLLGKRVGLACAEGLYLDRRPLEQQDCANWEAAQRVLLNRAVDAAVFENSPRSMAREGLAYDRCHVGVVTAIDAGAQIEDLDLRTPEQLYNLLRTQVDVVLADGAAVLNADDPWVVKLAELCDGDVIFVGTHSDSQVLADHRRAGKRCVVADGDEVVLSTGEVRSTLTELSRLPAVSGPRPLLSAPQLVAAVGAAWGLGVPSELMRAGLETFGQEPVRPSPRMNTAGMRRPGRSRTR